MIKLLALDLDGTCLNSHVEFDPETIHAIKEAIKKGVTVVPTSGRAFTFLPEEITSIDGIDYAITSNGAVIYDLETGEDFFRLLIPNEELITALALARKYNPFLEFHANGKTYLSESGNDRIGEFIDEVYHDLYREKVHVIPDDEFERMLEEEPLEKVNVRLSKEYLGEELKLLEAFNNFPNIEACRQGIGMVEMTYNDANKGVAIAEMANRLGIDCSEVMAIGDNDNDTSMLKFAGVGVAMGQSFDEVKEDADYVTDTYDNLGVAKAIEKFILDDKQETDTFPEELIKRVRKANAENYSNAESFSKKAREEKALSEDNSFESEQLQEPVVFCYYKCSTCKKALKWLDEHHVKYKEYEITETRPDTEEFIKIFKDNSNSIRSYFNTRGVLYRKMDLKDKLETLSEEEKAKLLAQNGMLIKRPLLLYKGRAISGFNPKKWSEFLNIDETS